MTKDQLIEMIERGMQNDNPVELIAHVIMDINRIANALEKIASPPAMLHDDDSEFHSVQTDSEISARFGSQSNINSD